MDIAQTWTNKFSLFVSLISRIQALKETKGGALYSSRLDDEEIKTLTHSNWDKWSQILISIGFFASSYL